MPSISISLRIGVSLCALLAGVGAGSTALANPAEMCSTESIQALSPEETTIVSAVTTAEPVPHCLIDGYVTTTNPGPNQVNFRLQLPDENFEGRYYFIGLGGTAGYVPTNSQIPSGNPIVKGFAVAGTDTGHQYGMGNWTFLGESEAKAIDHVHRGAHVTAQATQQITKAYYDTEDLYRYHSGCSGGGRMGMMAITRHPEDYDGVLLGAPGGRSSATMLAFIDAAQQMHREPGAFLSPAKLAMAEQKVTAKCDMLDGAKDDVVWDHTKCDFDFKTLQCEADDGPDCLTPPEIRTIEAILSGPQGPDGPLKVGFPISNMSTWSMFLGSMPPPWPDNPAPEDRRRYSAGYSIGNTLAKAYFGQDFVALTDFNLKDQEMLDAWWEAAGRVDYGLPYSADLNGYKDAGGKVIFWNGVSDSCCVDTEMKEYYADAAEEVGGMNELRKFARMYMVPGMAHCGGGTGPMDAPDQLLEALIDWVEKDKKPADVVAHRGDRAELVFADPKTGQVSGVVIPPPAGEARDFLLCADPYVAKFDGDEGGELDAENWSCIKPSKK